MIVYDHEEQAIHDAFSQITVDASGLTAKVKNRLNKKTRPSAPRQICRSVTVAAVMSMVLIVTVAAAALGGFDGFIEKFNPTYGDIVEPVEISCEDQGIRMEVIGAQKYDNMVVIYYSLQDISGENRLTETTNFHNGLNLKINMKEATTDGPEVGASYSYKNDVLYFDKETNTIYYELVIDVSTGDIFEPLTIGSAAVYFDTASYENEPSDVSLVNVENPDTVAIEGESISSMSGSNLSDELENSIKKALEFGCYADAPYGGDDMWISNIGIVDGKLHVQIGRVFNQEFGSNIPALSLMSVDGGSIGYDYSYTMICDKKNQSINLHEDDFNNAVYFYTEYVFSVDENSLQDYTLCFTGNVYSGIVGNWKVSAYLSDTSSQIFVWTDVAVNDISFEHIRLSPLGLQAKGVRWDTFNLDEVTVSVETAEGIVTLNASEGYNHQTGSYSLNCPADEPIDIASVTAIIVNGIRIPIE